MTQVTYVKKRGTYEFKGHKWHPGQTLDIKAEIAKELEGNPYFVFNGRRPAERLPASAMPVSTAPEDQTKLIFPALGFHKKSDAAEWAKANLGIDVDTNKALKTINDELLAATKVKNDPKGARREAALEGNFTDSSGAPLVADQSGGVEV